MTPVAPTVPPRPGTLDAAILVEVKRAYLSRVTPAPDDVWLDAGAHVGYATLALAPLVQRVVAYEPDPGNAAILKQNVAALGNVTVVQAALVGNGDATRTLHVNRLANTGSHSFHVTRGRVPVVVKAANVARAMTRHGVNAVKMDVEGAEAELVPAIDWSGVREVVLEFHFNALKDARHGFRAYEHVLSVLRGAFPRVEAPDPGRKWHTIVHATRRGRE